jgi:hypothetical protein
MAKRAPVDEQPYRPLLDPSVLSAAIAQPVPPRAPATAEPARPAAHKIVELTRPDSARRDEPAGRERDATDPAPGPGRAAAAIPAYVEKFDQEKRILFTRAESQAIDRLVTSLALRTNTQVKVSHVIRALVALLLNAEAEIDRRAGESAVLVRPPNGDAKALQRFEREIARVLGAGIRDAGPLK